MMSFHLLSLSSSSPSPSRQAFIEDIRQALYASKIVSYAQGFMLLREAAKVYSWNLNYGGIALMWRGGCIIRRSFLYTSTETVSIEYLIGK